MTDFLRVENITKSYGSRQNRLQVLKGVSFCVNPGEMTAIIGASGSGKTTLLQILGTLALPSSGELYFKGGRLFDKNPKELARFRNESIGFIFQFHHMAARPVHFIAPFTDMGEMAVSLNIPV